MGGQGNAGDDVHRPLGQRNLLLVGGVVIDDLAGEIFRVQIGQDLAVAGLGLGPEAHPEGVLIVEIALPQPADRTQRVVYTVP